MGQAPGDAQQDQQADQDAGALVQVDVIGRVPACRAEYRPASGRSELAEQQQGDQPVQEDGGGCVACRHRAWSVDERFVGRLDIQAAAICGTACCG
jgi:hypothetical protein